SLRRRRRIVECACLRQDAERLIDGCTIIFQISARYGAADAFEVTGNFAADITAIEIVKAGMCEMLESCSKLSLLEPGADVRNFAINQECFFEADRFVHLRQFFCRQPGLAASDRVAVARVLDGGPEAQLNRQLAALRYGCSLRKNPRAVCARDSERRERPTRGDLVVARVPIKPRRSFGAGASRSHERTHAAGGLTNQPEAIPPCVVH